MKKVKLLDRHKMSIGDVTLNYYEKGEGDILLFLHGNSMNSLSLQKLYNHFSQRYKVIAIDSRGHGLSDCGEVEYSISLLADDVFAFCGKREFSNISIIGYSDGGNIALMVAKKYPELIKQLIIISGNYEVSGIKKWFRKIIGFSVFFLKQFAKYFRLARIQKWKFDLMLNNVDISEEDLNKIDKPVLIIGAEDDLIYKKHLLDMNKNIKGSLLKIINRTNHFNIIVNKQIILTIDEFLE